jgi:hypothetical protein
VFRAAQSLSREDLAGGMPQKRAALRADGLGEDGGLGWWVPGLRGGGEWCPIDLVASVRHWELDQVAVVGPCSPNGRAGEG